MSWDWQVFCRDTLANQHLHHILKISRGPRQLITEPHGKFIDFFETVADLTIGLHHRYFQTRCRILLIGESLE